MDDINKQNVIHKIPEIILFLEELNNNSSKMLFNQDELKEIKDDCNTLNSIQTTLNYLVIDIDSLITNKKNNNKLADSLVELSLNIDEILWYLKEINQFIKKIDTKNSYGYLHKNTKN